MYKFYLKNGKAEFYERGIEIDGTIYGVGDDEDVKRIKFDIARSKLYEERMNDTQNEMPDMISEKDIEAEAEKITYSDVTFDVPTDEELSRIQSLQTNSMSAMKKHVRAVLDGELTQDEINAMLMLQIAQMRAGVEVE